MARPRVGRTGGPIRLLYRLSGKFGCLADRQKSVSTESSSSRWRGECQGARVGGRGLRGRKAQRRPRGTHSRQVPPRGNGSVRGGAGARTARGAGRRSHQGSTDDFAVGGHGAGRQRSDCSRKIRGLIWTMNDGVPESAVGSGSRPRSAPSSYRSCRRQGRGSVRVVGCPAWQSRRSSASARRRRAWSHGRSAERKAGP